jgi:hypothetical protein
VTVPGNRQQAAVFPTAAANSKESRIDFVGLIPLYLLLAATFSML